MAEKSRHFYEFGGFRLDADERVLLRGDEVVPLAPKAVETLVVLVEHRGHVVSKDDLMQRVWADAYVEENNLNQAVSALRKALGRDVLVTRAPGYLLDVAPEQIDAAMRRSLREGGPRLLCA